MFAPQKLETEISPDHTVTIRLPNEMPVGTRVRVIVEAIEPDSAAVYRVTNPISELVRQVILIPAEEGGYTVEVPSLPGCISEGDTLDEALDNIKEAIALYIDVLKEDGREIPPDVTAPLQTATVNP